MSSKSRWPTLLIVIITVGLVFGPVFVPREISRWYLAAAHNAFRKKDSVLAEHYLKQAEAWDANVKLDGDYWIAQLPNVNLQNVDEQLDLVERAVMTDSRWTQRAEEDAKILSEDYDFQHAVRALKIASLGQRPTTVDGLNQLAYMRSLAGIELDEALKDIDQAIAEAGPMASLLDTKAWVLHGLKRNVEALRYIDQAIQGLEKDFAKARVALPAPNAAAPSNSDVDSTDVEGPDTDSADAELAGSTDLQFLEQPSPLEPPISLRQRQLEIRAARRRIGEAGFVMAVMRFHRMRILESLKNSSEAAADRAWLVERGVPVVDELF